MTALLEYIDLYNKFSRGLSKFFPRKLYQYSHSLLCHIHRYTITHWFCPATHTVLNGVLGLCGIQGRGPKPLRTPFPMPLKSSPPSMKRVATPDFRLPKWNHLRAKYNHGKVWCMRTSFWLLLLTYRQLLPYKIFWSCGCVHTSISRYYQ